MPGIKVSPRDSFDDAYRKFKRQCDRNLIVTEARARQYYETKTEKRKKEKIATRKKILKKLLLCFYIHYLSQIIVNSTLFC